MQVFHTNKQIEEYLEKKCKILEEENISCIQYNKDFYGRTVFFLDHKTLNSYISVLLYAKHIGKNLVKEIQEYHKLPIITMDSCGIKDFLMKKDIPHKVVKR